MYTDDFLYDEVNTQMKTGASSLETTGGYVYFLKEAIKSRVNKQGCATGTLYRGMGLPKDAVYLYRLEDRPFVWPSFTSSSHSKSVAMKFAKWCPHDFQKTLFIIDTAGTGVTYAVDIKDVSVYTCEQEVLFYPYSGFKISSSHFEGDLLVVHVRTYDTQIYFNSFLQKFEECRHAFPHGEMKTPLTSCFYETEDGKKKCAMSSALLPKFASSATSWGNRKSVSMLAKKLEEGWTNKKHVYFIAAGAGVWSWFSVNGFGDAQAYQFGSNLDEIKKWVKGKWDEARNWCITSWAIDGDTHMVVMTTKADGYETGLQIWRTSNTWSGFQDEITTGYKDGYIITAAAFSKKKHLWVLVMTKSKRGQVWKICETFPQTWVKEQWSNRYGITTILNDGDKSLPWLVVMTEGFGNNNSWSTGLGGGI
jgi:hypothetical protein